MMGTLEPGLGGGSAFPFRAEDAVGSPSWPGAQPALPGLSGSTERLLRSRPLLSPWSRCPNAPAKVRQAGPLPGPSPPPRIHASQWTWALPNLQTNGERGGEGSAVSRMWVWAPNPH